MHKADGHADDDRILQIRVVFQRLQKRRRIAADQQLRAGNGQRALHRNARPRRLPRLRLPRDIFIRHEADRLTAQLPERRFADAGKRHLRVGDDHCAARQQFPRIGDNPRREDHRFRKGKIRRRVNHALDNGLDLRVKRHLQLALDDRHARLLDLHWFHRLVLLPKICPFASSITASTRISP